jgi:hypothetical protein
MQRPTLSSGRRGWYLAVRNRGQAAMGERKIAIAGVGGRMGRTLVRLVSETPGIALVAGIESAGSTILGADIGVLAGIDRTGVIATADALEAVRHADAVIDFTVPSASVALAALSRRPALFTSSAQRDFRPTTRRPSAPLQDMPASSSPAT